MKTMKQMLIGIAIIFFLVPMANAQNFNFDVKNAKQLIIENLLAELTFEGYDGNEITVEVRNFDAPPKRADGLKAIYGGGEDNSGIGLEFSEIDGSILIAGASKQSEDATYIIKVPNSMSIKVNYSSPFAEADQITFKNFSSEISVKTLDADINFENVSGPINSSTVDGTTMVAFGTVNQASPISISSIDGEIDVTLPSSTPADLKFSNLDGEVYTDFEVDFTKKDKTGSKKMRYIGGHNSSEGTINGGGVQISLQTIDGIIYLRKK